MTTSGKDGARDGADELDDPALRSMRAVWISMRDEEPPAGGLAELLAAAREQAEQMRPREPWWRRALVALRRSPVLAFATVLVLLGGAVAIGTRREAFEVKRPYETSADQILDRGAEKAGKLEASAETEAAGPAPARNEVRAKDSGTLAPSPGMAGDTAPGTGLAGVPTVVDEPARRAPARLEGQAPGPSGRSPVVSSSPPPPPPPAAPRITNREEAGAGPGGNADPSGVAGDHLDIEDAVPPPPSAPAPPPAEPPRAQPPRAQPPKPEPAKSVDARMKQDLQIADDAGGAEGQVAPVVTGSSRAPVRRGPSLSQLAKQADTAAAGGDCAAVRVIVDQIRKLDPAYHKAYVERSAAVKRCVK